MVIRAVQPFDGLGTLVDDLQEFDHTDPFPAWSYGSVCQSSGGNPPHQYIDATRTGFHTILRFGNRKHH